MTETTALFQAAVQAFEDLRENGARDSAAALNDALRAYEKAQARRRTDEAVVDAIATLLGTSAEWSSAADFLESIANLIGRVRPHPGEARAADHYAATFRRAVGRPAPAEWDHTPGDEYDATIGGPR